MSLPKHVAIIMDGNGRWAQKRGHNRIFGHIRGAKIARNIIVHCAERGLKHLTLFTFSTENWFRPRAEITFLMKLLVRQLRKEKQTLIKNNIRFKMIGNLNRLPEETRNVVLETIAETEHLTGMELTFALSYGGRQEICDTVRELAERVKQGDLEPSEIDESLIASSVASSFLPDPDLIVRTSGEHRLSNFFLWQAAYSELYVSPVLWPDFSTQDLEQAFEFYAGRERRFGRVKTETIPSAETWMK
ncbi:MAG: isoprenyl transferase [Bdellovibrionota bacterium]